jgi:hypothetical protein
MDNTPDDDFEPTSSIEPIPMVASDEPSVASRQPGVGPADPTHFGLVKVQAPVLPGEPYRGTAFWRRIIAVLGLGATAVAGGLLIAALIGAFVVAAAVAIEAIIS